MCFLQHFPYSIKNRLIRSLVFTGINCTIVLSACDIHDNPLAYHIAQLEKQQKQLAVKVRKSIKVAKIEPTDITMFMALEYAYDVAENGAPLNLLDTTHLFQRIVRKAWQEQGQPLPANDKSMTDMYNACADYIANVQELEKLSSR